MGVYEHLGVRTRINAAANGTSIGGSIMLPEVVAAMQDAEIILRQYPRQICLEKAQRTSTEFHWIAPDMVGIGPDLCYRSVLQRGRGWSGPLGGCVHDGNKPGSGPPAARHRGDEGPGSCPKDADQLL